MELQARLAQDNQILLMRSNVLHLPFSFLTLCVGTAVISAVIYVALIAVVMSYATLTVSFAQSVKNDQSKIAQLESQYLGSIAQIEGLDYQKAGYATPKVRIFVPTVRMTALR